MSETIIPPERFIDNPTLRGREDNFITINVKTGPVIASWRESLFAHEWLHKDGSIRSRHDMSDKMRARRQAAEELIQGVSPITRPVLGIGITDTLEIGSGRDILLALAAQGVKVVSVHIPKSHQVDFRMFIA